MNSETFYNHCLFSFTATILLGLYFHFCFELALKATASLRQSLGVHDLDSLVSSDQKMLLLTKKLHTVPEMMPFNGREVIFTHLFVLTR